MVPITNITDYPLQTASYVLPDGSTFTMTLYYIPSQLGWFILKLTYNDFVLTGLRITNNANLLYQYQNVLPFGLACFTASRREPTQQQDFSSGASTLNILSATEAESYTTFVEGGAIPS